MPSYIVRKDHSSSDGMPCRVGDRVEMTPRQAKYLLLSGKIAPAVATKKKPAKGD